MPRFQDEHVAALKAVMLKRVPECLFTAEDVEQLIKETGLNHAQILEWARHFRFRVEADQREIYLKNQEEMKVDDITKAYRFYVSGFNIDTDYIQNMTLKKARNAGNFTIQFVYAALNKEACSAEVYIELEESIRVCNLITQLEEQGACQVNVVTFKSSDAHESASSALLRVWMSAEKTGMEFIKGNANKELWDKTQKKFDLEMQKKEEDAKNQAKLDEGIKQSLAEVGNKLGNIGSKVDNMDGRMNSVQQGVCVIIPDYQKMLKENMDKLVHKTKEVDRIENRMGRVTHENNKLVMENEELKQKLIQESRKHEREMAEMKEILNRKDEKIRDTEQIIEMYKVLENVKYIMDLDRATKRARGET